MRGKLKIGVMGAGAVGCYIGGRLAAAGADVVFVGRDRLKAELEEHGLHAIELDGVTHTVPSARVVFSSDPAILADRDVTLCCVKSAQSAEAGQSMARALAAGAIVISMQNGVGNADILRTDMPAQTVLGGIVGFGILSRGRGGFRRTTSGPLVIEASADPRAVEMARTLAACGFEVEQSADLRPLQWAKLVMNLNNAVSALSGAPTKDILLSTGYRRILRAFITEALAVLRAAGIRPARLGAIPVQFFPMLLSLPTPALRLLARAQVKVDPTARSSMWEDLDKRRATEVDYLNGEIVQLAESCGARAPINRRAVELVHEVEALGKGSPQLDAATLWARLTAA